MVLFRPPFPANGLKMCSSSRSTFSDALSVVAMLTAVAFVVAMHAAAVGDVQVHHQKLNFLKDIAVIAAEINAARVQLLHY